MPVWWDKVKSNLSGAWDKAKQGISYVWDKTSGARETVSSVAKTVATKATGVFDYVANRSGKLVDAATGAATNALNGAGNFASIIGYAPVMVAVLLGMAILNAANVGEGVSKIGNTAMKFRTGGAI